MRIPATIANAASLSDGVDIKGPIIGNKTLVAISMPAAWTAASLTFQASHDNITFQNVYNAGGTEVAVTTDASRWVVLDPADFASVRYLKVRSGTSAAPVNQGAARELGLIVRRVD